MANNKPIGVAYADPELDSVTVTGTASIANPVSTASDGLVASNTNAGVYILSTAITANTTTTSAPAGSLGITTNATGVGQLFYSDGSKWQFAAVS